MTTDEASALWRCSDGILPSNSCLARESENLIEKLIKMGPELLCKEIVGINLQCQVLGLSQMKKIRLNNSAVCLANLCCSSDLILNCTEVGVTARDRLTCNKLLLCRLMLANFKIILKYGLEATLSELNLEGSILH